ncbi:MerR family transcriptional regulator [Nocardioides alcanivorans]|uniref:MerR family transcriptional regulator n=1 Tax=Nocardioides alcanivorans TaxID=2897352 RepID=UPI001F48E901|nr:MerR family transcriptional regulator [Nocardioides alcanivorans]
MYTIKHAAELIGVSDSTLRAWERRHGLNLSLRTPAGYRLYDDEAVRMLRLMRDLVRSGWAAREAAEEVNRTAGAAPTASTDDNFLDAADGPALAEVASTFDVAGLNQVLDRHFASASFETVVDGWLLPALRELGTAWEDGRVSVAGEHMVAHGVIRRLATAYDAAGDNRSRPRVIVGLPPGSRHDLGLLAFATAARRAGLATTYLGADVPIDDWIAAATIPSVGCAVLAVPMAEDSESLAHTVSAMVEQTPDLLVAVGGSGQDLAPEHCLRLGHEIGPAARLLASTLASASTRPSADPAVS